MSVLLLLLVLASPPITHGGPCVCDGARLHDHWCGACDVGYVAGLEIRSALLFEELDAHGHDIDPDVARARCASCRVALDEDGFCERCRWGYRDGQLYATRLTWLLASGRTVHPGTVTCDTCASDARETGWCDACEVGRVGPVAYRDRSMYDAAVVEYGRLEAAIRASARCGTCAAALLADTTCPECRITYSGGRGVYRPPPGFLGGW